MTWHVFTTVDGKVTYQRRYLQSDSYKSAMEKKIPVYDEFGTLGQPDPCKNIFQRYVL